MRAPSFRVFSVLSSALLLSCAGQVPPSGGPVDTVPPEVLSVYPEPNSTFFRDNRIALEFSEYVDQRSLEQTIFISPYVGTLEFDWSGTEVEVTFSEDLKENTTYVVSVGTDVVDLRNRNRMASAFTLAFSTGEKIDRGVLSGTVFPARRSDPRSGIMVFAYKVDQIERDTLNPREVRPDYITQTGTDGTFVLNHLAFGEYRVLAVRDDFKNLLYDPETDEIGTAAADFSLSDPDTARTGILIRIAREDTTAPRLVKVSGVHRRMILAEFSEGLDSSTVKPERFEIQDTVSGRSIRVQDVSPVFPKRNAFFVTVSDSMNENVHRLQVRGVRDSAGIEITSLARALDFVPETDADTAAPVIRFNPADSSKNHSVSPIIQLVYNEPVRNVDWSSPIGLSDSLGRSIALSGGWDGHAAIVVQPQAELAGLSWYRLQVRQGRFADYSGNTMKDTVRNVWFQTLDAERFSSIQGRVVDVSRKDTAGAIIVRATEAAGGGSHTHEVTARGETFEFTRLLEGSYLLDAYRDRNGNGKHDAGRASPFLPAERFSVLSDTLKLRARWPLEGVTLELK